MLRSLYPLESSVGLGAHRERPPHTAPSRAAQNSMAWPRPLSTTDRLIFQMTLLSSSGPTFLTKALPEMTDCELSSAQQESASVKASAVPDSKGLGDAGPGVAEGTGPFGWDPGSPHEACQAPASGSLTGKRACSPPTVYTWAAPSLIM